jgi:hypothetical protein
MKLLTLPGAYFSRVAHASDRALVSLDYRRGEHTIRFWDLAGDSSPRRVPYPQNLLVWILFLPGGERLLRVQGLWPEGVELPPALSDDLATHHPLLTPDRTGASPLPPLTVPRSSTASRASSLATTGPTSTWAHLEETIVLSIEPYACLAPAPPSLPMAGWQP